MQDFEFVHEVADMIKEEDNYTQESLEGISFWS